jgi:hypothetical protein
MPVEVLLKEHPGEGGDAEDVTHAPDAPHHHLKVRIIFYKTESLVLKGLSHEKDLAFDDMYG